MYHILHINKLFTTNGFDGYLDGRTIKPPKQIIDESGNTTTNTNYNTYMLINQNFVSTLYSIILSALLPYVLNMEYCSDIWKIIEERKQYTNISQIL